MRAETTTSETRDTSAERRGLDWATDADAAARRSRWVDLGWLGLGLLAGVVVYGSYLVTHQYPAYAGGLFLVMAETVAENGYTLPTTIPYYTETGVPFAYPPLVFYLTAAAHELTGLPWVAFSRYVPGIAVIAALVPYYAIARDLLGSPRRAGLATVLYATAPTVLRWHLSAGGLVRAPAMLLTLTGLWVGLRLFKWGDRRWIAPGAALFGLTVLTHPTYSVFFAMSYVLLYAFYDRQPAGLVAGALVALGGLAVAAPWLLAVVDRHGLAVFHTASGTHSGLAGGLVRLVVKLGYPLDELNAETAYYLLAYAGGLYALLDRRLLLPTWAVAASWFVGKNRFLFVAGSMLSAVLVVEAVVPAIRARTNPNGRQLVAVLVAVVVVAAAVAVGGLYAASRLPVAHERSPSQPEAMDDYDRAAMAWARANTAPEADFVVLGDQGEWLPLYAERAILLGPWGWEWKDREGYYRELDRYDRMASCQRAACVSWWLARTGRTPAYVYVPRGAFTVRGKAYRREPAMARSMVRADRYDLVFRNPGVLVFRVEYGPPTGLERSPSPGVPVRGGSDGRVGRTDRRR